MGDLGRVLGDLAALGSSKISATWPKMAKLEPRWPSWALDVGLILPILGVLEAIFAKLAEV